LTYHLSITQLVAMWYDDHFI